MESILITDEASFIGVEIVKWLYKIGGREPWKRINAIL